jgi:stearoyl-CoA desaturase (delta-9 desaturase)
MNPVHTDSELNPPPSVLEQLTVLAVIVAPAIALCYGVHLAWQQGGVDLFYLALAVLGYVFSGLGITVGFHRLFTHDSFKAKPVVTFAFAVLGCTAIQGTILDWCGRHTVHHQKSDKEGDPHSPWKFGTGSLDLLKGYLHAHCLWIFREPAPEENGCIKRLKSDPVVMFVHKTTWLWILLGLTVPTVLGYVYSGTAYGAWLGFIWGGLVRVFIVQHVTWSVNSYCHVFGTRQFDTPDQSRNSLIFGLLAFGEGWHNNHHRQPNSCLHGFKTPWLDLSYWVIRVLEKAGLVTKLIMPTPANLSTPRSQSD